MFGPKSSVLTVVKRATEVRSNLYSKSYCTAWSFYAVLYVYMFNKETTIKAKLANMNVKVWWNGRLTFYSAIFHLPVLPFSSVPINMNSPSTV